MTEDVQSQPETPYILMLGDAGPFAAMSSHLGRGILDVENEQRSYPPQAVVINSEDDNDTIARLKVALGTGVSAPVIVIAGANQALMEFSAAGAAMVLPRETSPKHLAASVFGMVNQKVRDASLFDVWCIRRSGRVFMCAVKSRTYYAFTAEHGPSGAAKSLTDKEISIVEFLLANENRQASRQQLLDQVWGYNSNVTTHTLETHIYRLRQKIGAAQKVRGIALAGGNGEVVPADFIATISGGYAMRGRVSLHKSPERRLNLELAADIFDQSNPSQVRPEESRSYRTLRVASPAEADAAIQRIKAAQGLIPT